MSRTDVNLLWIASYTTCGAALSITDWNKVRAGKGIPCLILTALLTNLLLNCIQTSITQFEIDVTSPIGMFLLIVFEICDGVTSIALAFAYVMRCRAVQTNASIGRYYWLLTIGSFLYLAAVALSIMYWVTPVFSDWTPGQINDLLMMTGIGTIVLDLFNVASALLFSYHLRQLKVSESPNLFVLPIVSSFFLLIVGIAYCIVPYPTMSNAWLSFAWNFDILCFSYANDYVSKVMVNRRVGNANQKLVKSGTSQMPTLMPAPLPAPATPGISPKSQGSQSFSTTGTL
ncbi:hypothetical protein HDV03_000685 [Kappamyces sp. JEL0829]|nr:hypothetical protein HDV03_000685 [Kappamyces sp. JEL0829]